MWQCHATRIRVMSRSNNKNGDFPQNNYILIAKKGQKIEKNVLSVLSDLDSSFFIFPTSYWFIHCLREKKQLTTTLFSRFSSENDCCCLATRTLRACSGMFIPFREQFCSLHHIKSHHFALNLQNLIVLLYKLAGPWQLLPRIVASLLDEYRTRDP